MGERVVAVTHELTRTGAPMSLLHVVRWLAGHTALDLQVVAGRPSHDQGDLFDDFAAVVPTTVVPEMFDATTSSPGLPGCDVLYVNSLLAAGCLTHLPQPHPYVICRVPELAMSFSRSLSPEARGRFLATGDRFIAVSSSVRDMLVDRYDVDAATVSIVPGSVDLSALTVTTTAERSALRRELGIPDDALVVGAAGTTDWRKGPDLFVRAARMVQERIGERPVHFLWLGGELGGPPFWRVERRELPPGTADRVHFLGSRPDPYAYYQLMDVFALTSREDPFPRVCMEVAAVGVPIVTFESGGATELVAKGCGHVVPYLDVDTFAARVVELLEDESARDRMGATGREVVRRDHTVDQGGPATLAEIERGLRAGTR